MLNHITLMGRLTKDPEMRTTQSGKSVSTFTLAVDRDIGEETDFINCVCWGKTAEFADRWLHKGQLIAVAGRIQSRLWTDKSEAKRVSWEVIVDRVYFTDKLSESPKSGKAVFTEPEDEEEIPF